MDYRIRTAEAADAKAVHDIYGYYVENSDVTFTTENPEVEDYRAKIENTQRAYPFLVAEAESRVLGFAYGAQVRPHDAYRWNVESTIYLAPDAPRRCGIGSALYTAMMEMLAAQGFKTVYGVLTASNAPSIAMHRALGFEEVGRFENMGFKRGQWHGIVWMKKDIGSFGPCPAEPVPFSEYRKQL